MRPALEPLQQVRRRAGARGCADEAAAHRQRHAASSSVHERAPAAAGSSTLPARWAVASTYSPGSSPRRAQQLDALGARGWTRSRDVHHHVADELDAARRRPRAADSSTATSEEHSSSELAWSASTRLSSSGIARSNERMPASTCATGTPPARRPARRQASSWCRRRRARRRADLARAPARAPPASALSARCSIRARCPSSRSGARDAELGEEHRATARRRSAGRCGPAPPRARAQRRRDRRRLDELRAVADHGEDLHRGAVSADGRRSARVERARRARDLRRLGPRPCVELALVDRAHRLHLAHGRGQERLVRAQQLLERARLAPARPARRSRRARVIDARMCSSSGGVSSLAALDPEDRARRRLEHAPVRRDQQRLVEAALAREPRGEHVRRVRQRLDAVEDRASAHR